MRAATFEEEYHHLREILPNALWEKESDYPPLRDGWSSFFHGLANDADKSLLATKHADPGAATARPEWTTLPGTGLLRSGKPFAAEALSRAVRTDESFSEAIGQSLGVDLAEIWSDDRFAPPEDVETRSRLLAAFTAEFGTEAFGMYLPFHAFFASGATPWGIYLVPEKMIAMARILHEDGQFLPAPKPSPSFVLRMLWWMTWRHELFHYHVEKFATRQEVCGWEAIYRPYVENHVATVRGTEDWLEEALAQAVVVDSQMIRRALGVNSLFVENYLKPFLRTFPPGYRDFECKGHTSVTEAHIRLAADILGLYHVTSQFTPLTEYVVGARRVPAYLVVTSTFASRFQLATPELRKVLRYCNKRGYRVDEDAKGDHKRALVNGTWVQINRSRSRKEADIASLKQMAKAEGLNLSDLMGQIRDC